MSHLPLAIDTLITEKDVAAAKKAILKAKATLPTRNASAPTFPPIAVPHRLSEDQNYLFQASEVYYECMEWTNLYQSINRLQQALPKAPHALESRKRLAHCMLASAPYFSTAYRDTAANLAVDPADGDLYLGMALIKLSEFYLVDCGHLIELAALCPTYHPHVMSLAREKLEWTQSSGTYANTATFQLFKRRPPSELDSLTSPPLSLLGPSHSIPFRIQHPQQRPICTF